MRPPELSDIAFARELHLGVMTCIRVRLKGCVGGKAISQRCGRHY